MRKVLGLSALLLYSLTQASEKEEEAKAKLAWFSKSVEECKNGNDGECIFLKNYLRHFALPLCKGQAVIAYERETGFTKEQNRLCRLLSRALTDEKLVRQLPHIDQGTGRP